MMIFYRISGAAYQQQSHRFCARIFERVRSFTRNKDSVARFDCARLCADGHLSRSAQYVIDFFCYEVMMTPDLCADGQDFFGQTATLDAACRAINERTNLRSVWRVDDGGALAINDKHS